MSDIEQKCECAVCALKIDFLMDNHLIEEIERSNAIIFAGAGISTESKLLIKLNKLLIFCIIEQYLD